MQTLKNIRWALSKERRGTYEDESRARWHREGIATMADGTEISFCGEYHPGECAGSCGLPRLIRKREDGVFEAARVGVGICSVFCAELARGHWEGPLIEVEYPGNPMWR